MRDNKVFKFDNIDLYLNEDNNLVFKTAMGGECVFDPIRNIFLYDTTDEYNKIFIDCFLEDNEYLLENWETNLKNGDLRFRDTR